MREKGYPESIIRGDTFRASKNVLEGKARILRQNGKGKQPNRARSLTTEEEKILWESKQLGVSNPRALINTVWWNNCLHFGMRSREEHYHISMEDFSFEIDSLGRQFVSYNEGVTKTRKGGLNYQERLIKPKMYASHDENCPVKIFLLFKSKRPESLRENGPLYLSPIDKPKTNVWFKTQRIGVNSIDSILKKMKENSPLASMIPNKKITNHSARKTSVRKMKSAGFQKCEIKNITGHANEKGLDPYDSGNEEEMFKISSAIKHIHCDRAPSSTLVKPPPLPFSTIVKPPKPTIQQSSNRPICNSAFDFGIRWCENRCTVDQPFIFNNCHVTINQSNSSTETSKVDRRRRLRIESDSEDEL